MKGKTELVRALSLTDAVGVGLGAIIGAGIFVVTGVAAGVSGPSFLVGLLVAGLVASFNGLSSAQLAAVYPRSGGTYEYGYQLLNPVFGFSAGWMFLVSKLSAAGVVAIGFGTYFYQIFPFGSPAVIAAVAVILLTVANMFGIRKAGKLNLFIVSITLISLSYFIFSGFPEVQAANFTPFAPFGFSGIAESAAILFFAFTGYARIATLAEEVRNPEKTIPKAIIITIISAIVLYSLVSFVAVGLIGTLEMSASKSPLQLAAQSLNSPFVSRIIIIGAAAAMLGVLLSQILGISRMMFAMGRRRDLPSFFERIHPKYKVPHVGIGVTGAIVGVLATAGNFEFIVRTASFTILVYYGITNIAALQQPQNQQRYGKMVAVLGLAGCLAMAVSLPFKVIAVGIVILLTGFLLRSVIKKIS